MFISLNGMFFSVIAVVIPTRYAAVGVTRGGVSCQMVTKMTTVSFVFRHTAMIVTFPTDKSGQTVKTHIRLLLEKGIMLAGISDQFFFIF